MSKIPSFAGLIMRGTFTFTNSSVKSYLATKNNIAFPQNPLFQYSNIPIGAKP
jgi:hypothetical protein